MSCTQFCGAVNVYLELSNVPEILSECATSCENSVTRESADIKVTTVLLH